jgi:acetyltransferase-like isoleucine patch superfamily enzyme
MKRLIEKLKYDFNGVINLCLEQIFSTIATWVSIFLMKIITFFKGIQIDKGCKFFGLTKFRRYYGSKIIIEKNCRFRSAEYSNFVGLNHKCMISTLKKGAIITIGEGSGMSGTVIGCAERITIGKNVLLGGNTVVTDTDWHAIKRDAGQTTKTSPVIIGDDVFIGLNTIILKGTTIGSGSVIGANSVVSGNIPSFVIAAGNPCKIIKQIV